MPSLDRIVDDLTQQIPELLVRHHVPGLAIGVCDRSGLRWSHGFGATRADGGEPVTPSTMFSVQSCSKMYTAAVVMGAVEQGLVELDRPITAYLPEFTVNSCFEGSPEAKITLRHLLGSCLATFYHRAITREAHRAVGHDRRHRRVPLCIPMVPSGGLYTSVEDACRFVQMHLAAGKPVLSAGSLAEMSTIPFPAPGQATGYGLGLALSRRDGRTVDGHNGGGFGFLADYCWEPVVGVGVVVLTNSVDHPLQGRLAPRVLDELAGPPASTASAPPGAAEVAVSAARLRRLAGRYVGREHTIALMMRDGQLVLCSAGRPARLRMTAEDEFFVEADPVQRFRVLPDQNGHPTYLQNTYSGFTCYRNDDQGQSADDVADTQEFLITSGISLGPAQLQHLSGGDAILGIPDEPPLLLHGFDRGRFISATGEVLDLRQNPPTYASIQLHPQHPQSAERAHPTDRRR